MATKRQQQNSSRGALGCLAGIILVFAALHLFLRQFTPGGAYSGARAYQAPVLPMTVLSGEELTARRTTELDFSVFDRQPGDILEPNEVIVTDRYALTNPGTAPVTAELAYPFFGSLNMDSRFFPTLTADGQPIPAELRPALDPAGALNRSKDWKDFRKAFLEHDPPTDALTQIALPDTPVVVYEITELHSDRKGERYLAAEFTMDPDETTLWTWGTMGMVDDAETGRYARVIHVPSPEEYWVLDRGYLIVAGADIENLTLTGYDSYDLTEEHRIEGVTGQLSRRETTFPELLAQMARETVTAPEYGRTEPMDIPWELLYEGAAKRLASESYQGTGKRLGVLEELLRAAAEERGILYQVFPVTIPAGGTVTVEAVYHQKATCEGIGPGAAADTVDLATKLGSSLTFESQHAALRDFDDLRIVRQNFGFDPGRGIFEVELALSEEYYYLSVAPKN